MKKAGKDGFGGLGIAGVASTLVIGATGLLITVAAVAAIVVVRRRRTACDLPDDAPIAGRDPDPMSTDGMTAGRQIGHALAALSAGRSRAGRSALQPDTTLEVS